MLYIQPKLIPEWWCSVYSSAVDGAGDTDLLWNPSDLGWQVGGVRGVESSSPTASGPGRGGLNVLEYILRALFFSCLRLQHISWLF